MKRPPIERIKPEVRAIGGYHLKAYDCPVKLNQNESPFDVPEELKAQILETIRQRPWSRYPQPMPADLVETLARHTGWGPEGLIVCNGSNTLVQLVLAVSTSPESVDFAASKGLEIMVGGPTAVMGQVPQVMALWHEEMKRNRTRLLTARGEVAVGKLSGSSWT